MKRKLSDAEEYIMVFPRSLLMETGYFQGLSFDVKKFIGEILDQKNYKFMIRKSIESDTNYKQLIPYVILKHKDTIFSYRRGKMLSEERLMDNYSIGIGGHISVSDHNLFTTTYEEGLNREVMEEVTINCNYENKMVAIINDDTNDVGKVHFGVIHIFTLEKAMVVKREGSIADTKFMSVPELKNNIQKFENWSKICINEIEKILTL
jgi:predicted NUDIX family phosphoesterase